MRSGSLACLKIVFLVSLIACSDKKNKPSEQNAADPGDSSKPIKAERYVNPYVDIDVSPMDMSYYPADFPKLKMEKRVSSPPVAKVIYSRPHLGGRKLFTEVQKYGEPWRLGANEATELQFFRDVTIQGKKIKAGRYVIYCIPQEDKWTIVLNSNIDSWGLTPDTSMDLYRFEVPSKKTDRHAEFFTIVFEKMKEGAEMVMTWDTTEARLPIVF